MTDTERDRLATLLAAPAYRERAMRPDELQGFCVAIAMGPDDEVPPAWLDVVLGDSAEETADETADETRDAELVGLLAAFREQTARALDARELRIEARTARTGRVDYSGWCGGFLAGAKISPTDWFAVADPEDLEELMFPIDVLGGALSEQERASYKPAQWRTLVRDCEAALQASVTRLADYWAIVRTPPVTIRRDLPKVGRNDPCPCGSARKFKQCHGKS